MAGMPRTPGENAAPRRSENAPLQRPKARRPPSLAAHLRTLLTTLAAAPLASALPRAARAAYPDRPVRVIVPFAAGGNADLVARLCAEGMKEALGQPFVVEYRTGAGGSLGAEMATKA